MCRVSNAKYQVPGMNFDMALIRPFCFDVPSIKKQNSMSSCGKLFAGSLWDIGTGGG